MNTDEIAQKEDRSVGITVANAGGQKEKAIVS